MTTVNPVVQPTPALRLCLCLCALLGIETLRTWKAKALTDSCCG